jgi:hypothetical protein
MPEQPKEMDARMSVEDLYLEEVFTDRRVGTIQRLTPVTPEGSPDPARSVVYVGQTQILTPGGALPLSFDIPATSLEGAVGGFAKAAEEAVQDTMSRLQELRREAASSLIVPGAGGPEGMGGGIPGGGIPGGGKIRMP